MDLALEGDRHIRVPAPDLCADLGGHANHSLGRPNKAAGHAWLVAPPFKVVDVTIKWQDWSSTAMEYLPRLVASEDASPTSAGPEDWLDADLYLATVRSIGRTPTMADLKRFMQPGHVDGAERLGIWYVKAPLAGHCYLTTGIGAPLEQLEDIRPLRLSGRYPRDLWHEFARL